MFNKYKIMILGVALLIAAPNKADGKLVSAVEKFKLAYTDLDFFIKKGLIVVSEETFRMEDYIYTNYHIKFGHILAAQSLDEYKKQIQNLGTELLLNSSRNGLLAGIAIACLNKVAGNEKFNKKAAFAVLMSTVGRLLCQAKQVGSLPYYSATGLKPKNNLLLSYDSLLLYASTELICAATSYFGTSCILDRLDRFRKIKSTENISVTQV